MSRLMRAELERQNRGGPIRQFLNRPAVIVTLFLLSVGLIVWTFWPASAEHLYRRGAALMASDDPDDWARGWDDYLEPLTKRYPDNPYRTEVEEFRAKYQGYKDERAAARASRQAGPMTEAQWFYQEGLRRRQVGDEEGARKVWRLLVDAFGPVRAERPWVRKAQEELNRLPGETTVDRHLGPVAEVIAKAKQLRESGKAEEADAVLKALRELYRGDKGAEKVLNGK
jgi:hypothetical protein